MTGIVVVLAAVGILLIFLLFCLPSLHSRNDREGKEGADDRLAEERRFASKEVMFSRAEASFYGALNLALGAGYVAFPKVRMSDVLQPVENGRNGKRALNQILQKHLDFVICREGTWEIVGAVELDDASHRRADRKTRDSFVDVIFSGAGVPLVRVPAQSCYSVQELRAKLAVMTGNASAAKEAQLRMELAA